MLFQVRPLAGACRTQAAWRACVVAGRLIPAAPAGLTPPGLLSSRRRRSRQVWKERTKEGKISISRRHDDDESERDGAKERGAAACTQRRAH